jgi:hypothetical protein
MRQAWLLKNSLREIKLKKHRVRMPYKRFSSVAYTFLVTDFDSVFRKIDFFNTHSQALVLIEHSLGSHQPLFPNPRLLNQCF